jgi:predicted RNase H-like HicB family nuclease
MREVTFYARLGYERVDNDHTYPISVTFPDVPGANSCGESREDAIEMAKDALECWFSDGDEPVPPASRLDELEQRADCALNEEYDEYKFEFVPITIELP